MLQSFHVISVFLGQQFLRRTFLMTPPHFDIFVIISPLKRTWPLIWKKLEFSLPKDNLYKVWLNLACWFWRRFFFFKFQCIFTLLLLSPLGEGQSPSFEQTWIPSFQGWFKPSLIKIGPVVLEKIFKWPHLIITFLWLSPLRRGPGPYLNKHEFPSPKDNVYQVWLNLACWFWRRRFLKIFSVFFSFAIISPWRLAIPFI
jgi:hypothetical protein